MGRHHHHDLPQGRTDSSGQTTAQLLTDDDVFLAALTRRTPQKHPPRNCTSTLPPSGTSACAHPPYPENEMPRTRSHRLQTNASARTCIRKLTPARRTHCPAGDTPPAPRNTFLSSRALHTAVAGPALVKNTKDIVARGLPAISYLPGQATTSRSSRPHAGEPRIAEPRPRRRPSKCRPLTARGSDTGATLSAQRRGCSAIA